MVESTLIDVEYNEKLKDGNDVFGKSLSLFLSAVEETSNLQVVGTSFNKEKKEIFVIEDVNNNSEHIEVLISEIIEKVDNIGIAREFVKVMMGERSPIVLNGITRIVGYFSRVNNWNRSKIGELRDRRKGEYSVSC